MHDDIDRSPGIALAEGWHPVERAAETGQAFRWTSLLSALVVDPRESAMADDGHFVIHAGSPEGQGERQIAMVGPGGATRQPIQEIGRAHV